MKQELSNLIEFGADQGNVKRTVFYNITRNKLFVGNSVPFPMIFLPGAGAAVGTFIGGPIGTVAGFALGVAFGWAMDNVKFDLLNHQSITDVAKDALTKTTDAIGDGLKTIGGWFS